MEAGSTMIELVRLGKTPADCWGWLGRVNPDGFAVKSLRRKTITARVWMYQTLFGPIPEGLVVSSTCGDRQCCNPHHLVLRTMAEACQAGTVAQLTCDDVRTIRRLVKLGGIPQAVVADRFGVSTKTVSHAVNMKSWKPRRNHALHRRKSNDASC